MSLKGNLASVNLTEIFQMLSLSGREGTLFIYEGPRKRAICFTKDGVSIRSRERNESNLIGKILVRLGKIEEDDLQRAVELRRSSQSLLGDVLVDMKACSRDDVESAFRIQSEEDIQDLFLNRNDAQFEYIDGFFPETDGPYVNLNVNSLLIEIARRTDEWEYIRRRIRGPREIYRFSGAEPEIDGDVLAECYSHRIDPFIDGTNSVAELIEASYVSKFEVCKLLAAYLDAGVVELVPPEAIRTSARMALRMGDPESAIRHYEYLMSTGDYATEVIGEAAEAHEAMRDFAEAAALLRRLAAELVREGDHRGAIDALRRVANYPRPEPDALRFLLDLVFENPRAAADFEEHVIEGGKTLVAYLIKHEQRADAFELVGRLLRTFPDEVSFAATLVNVIYEDGNAEKAARECERLANAFLKRRKPTHAVSLYKKLLIIDPERGDIRERIRKITTGKRRRTSSGALPRMAIALAVALLLGGVAVVLVREEGRSGPGTGGMDDGTLAALFTRAVDEQGQAEQHSTLAADVYGRLLELIRDDHLAHREQLLKELRTAQQTYKLFEDHAERAHEIAETILRQAADERTTSRARSMVMAIRDRETEVRAARSRWQAVAQDVAEKLYDEGIARYEVGKLGGALELFTFAQALSTRREWKVDVNLDQYITNLQSDSERVRQGLEAARHLEQKGQWAAARATLLALLQEFRSADLVEEMLLPVEVLTLPLGAEILIDDTAADGRTPAIVRVSPFRKTPVVLRKAGYQDQTLHLGPFEEETDATQYTYIRALPRAATWARNVGGAIEAAPVAWGDKVACAIRSGEWQLLDSQDGKRTQRKKLETFDGVAAGLVTDGRFVYVPTLDGKVFVVGCKDARPRTRLPDTKDGIYATPVTAEGLLYVVDHAGVVRAIEPATGRARWQEKTSHGVRADLVAQGPDLVVVTTSGEVTVLRRATGELVKRYRLPGAYNRAPVPAGDDELLFASEAGVLRYVERVTGEERWSMELEKPLPAAPVVKGHTAFVCLRPEELTAIDTRTGDVMYRYRRSGDAGRAAVAPTDRILFACGKTLSAYAARSDGYALAWSFEANGRILGGPVVFQGVVYFGDDQGYLYRLERDD
jgi:outer membrane protein assembly factor BamB/tetratricopeptide (TPR) repeat protein